MPTITKYVSSKTNTNIKNDIQHQARYFSKDLGVELALVLAIIKQESQFVDDAKRFEPHLKDAKWHNKWLSDEEQKIDYSYYSMGVMQVLFAIAKSYGFKGAPHELLNPKLSIAYGTMHLRKLIKDHYYLADVISVYNYGSVAKDNKGKYKNQKYVENVYKYYKAYGGKINWDNGG